MLVKGALEIKNFVKEFANGKVEAVEVKLANKAY